MTSSQIAHDPELPFAVVGQNSGRLYARFLHRREADLFVDSARQVRNVEVIDTTPKPRIPVDAKYLVFFDREGRPEFAYQEGEALGVNLWKYSGVRYAEDGLLPIIGDREITVLDPRPSSEES